MSQDPDNRLAHKLLIPGWAGDLSPDELAFIKAELKKNRRLRATWGMGRGRGRINDEKIKAVAMHGVDGVAALSAKSSEVEQGR